jgi:hypothetical protein
VSLCGSRTPSLVQGRGADYAHGVGTQGPSVRTHRPYRHVRYSHAQSRSAWAISPGASSCEPRSPSLYVEGSHAQTLGAGQRRECREGPLRRHLLGGRARRGAVTRTAREPNNRPISRPLASKEVLQ